LKINSNIASLIAQRNLAITTKALSRGFERLASGNRITRAGDDASGLAMGVGLESQLRGLSASIRNINDGRAYLVTADAAFGEMGNLVQRMREIAIQSSNGTMSNRDRSYLEKEFYQLLAEFDRIADQTSFGSSKLLNGSLSGASLQVGPQAGNIIDIALSDTRSNETFRQSRGQGTFKGSEAGLATLVNAIESRFEDLNADGREDLVFICIDAIHTRLAVGQGEFGNEIVSGFPDRTHSDVISTDLNNDGKLDFAYTNGQNLISMISDGAGFFAPVEQTALFVEDSQELLFADIDGDGSSEMISLGQSGVIEVFEKQSGQWALSQVFSHQGLVSPALVNVRNLHATDFDEDGILDLKIENAIYRGLGNGQFETSGLSFVGENGGALVRDFDEDGDSDFFDILQDRIYWNDGDGQFSRFADFEGPAWSGADAALGDVDGDGNIDIVRAGSGQQGILYGLGGGRFSSNQALSFDSNPRSVRLFDFDGDGFLDLFHEDDSMFYVRRQNVASESIVDELQVGTQKEAQKSLEFLDLAMNEILERRASLGAQLSRLDVASNVAMITQENLAAARSQVMDVDYALETAELVKNQFLQQAQVAVLTQANFSMRLIVSLLDSRG
jgi:flagellin